MLRLSLFFLLSTLALAQDAPVAVTCELDSYALCAYANCTINADLKTANCPCIALSGPSVARIDLIPDENVKQSTIASPENNNASICEAIADKSLWEGADAVSTFSRATEEVNNVNVNDDGTRGDPTWTCSGVEGRLVPNCMLAPCRILDPTVTNPYYDGEAAMECTCPLIAANVDYTNFGGLQSPCEDSPVPMEGGYVQNAGGALLNQYAMDSAAVSAAWEAVEKEFNKEGSATGSSSSAHSGTRLSIIFFKSTVIGFFSFFWE